MSSKDTKNREAFLAEVSELVNIYFPHLVTPKTHDVKQVDVYFRTGPGSIHISKGSENRYG